MPTFECHSKKQQEAIFSEAKTTLLCTGIQFGKTTAGSIWMKRLLHSFTDKDDNFIITSPNYKILQQSTLPAFLKFMDGFGEYSKGDQVFKMHEGGTVYLRTATEPDSIVGITNVRGIWGDEAGKYSLYFWENMQARASFRDCPIMLTTSPYSTNWVFKELIKGVRAGKRSDINLIQASSDENPYFPKEEFRRRKQTMDPLRFAALYLGEFSRMHGLVYDCFDEDVHTILPCELPTGTKYYAGIDWGFTDPFVMQVIAVTPGGVSILVSEFYKTRTTINDQILIAKQKKQTYGITTFFCGPDQPASIEEFNRNGLPAVGANNSIRIGIDCIYEKFKSGTLKLFKSACPQTLDELENYHYPEPGDLDPDEDSSDDLPVGQNDHCLDALRYVVISTHRSHIKHTPKQIEEKNNTRQEYDHEKRLKLLKKSNRGFRGTENFS